MNKERWIGVLLTWLVFVSVTLHDYEVRIEVFEKSDYVFIEALMLTCERNVFCFS